MEAAHAMCEAHSSVAVVRALDTFLLEQAAVIAGTKVSDCGFFVVQGLMLCPTRFVFALGFVRVDKGSASR